ncbi:hypothetical protein [Psychroflexus tropicus]|uniref:hypothetical protein n=1 Tax=Psychroflexus tropicus TaxID=197345 RepID=UPI000376512D|nr:hypothetical protein [Psychroflexus tropicus]
MKTIKLLSLSLVATLLFSACSDDDDVVEVINEEEEITTMNVYLTPEGGQEFEAFSLTNLDGGVTDPVVTTSTLDANTSYTGRMEFLNENEEPVEDITEEVIEEDEEHQVFFIIGSGLDVSTEYLDSDANGNPLGVEFSLETGETSIGNLTFALIHEGDKEAGSDGILDESVGGETDIQYTFDVTVE